MKTNHLLDIFDIEFFRRVGDLDGEATAPGDGAVRGNEVDLVLFTPTNLPMAEEAISRRLVGDVVGRHGGLLAPDDVDGVEDRDD